MVEGSFRVDGSDELNTLKSRSEEGVQHSEELNEAINQTLPWVESSKESKGHNYLKEA